jgi:hypothetical protein
MFLMIPSMTSIELSNKRGGHDYIPVWAHHFVKIFTHNRGDPPLQQEQVKIDRVKVVSHI